jgi:type IV secretory pathway VirB4 component
MLKNKTMFDHKRNFENVFPYFAFEDNLLVLSDGRVGIGYRVQGIEMERLSTGEFNKIGENVSQALKSLAVGACVQLLNFYYYEKSSPTVRDKNYYEQRFIHSFGERLIQRHEQYLFISLGEEKDYTLTNNWFGRGGQVFSNTFKTIATHKKKIENIASQFISLVGINGLTYQRLTEIEVMQVLCQYFNLDFTPNQDQIFKTFTPDKERLILGTDTVNIISMSGQPTNVNNDMDNGYNVSSPQLYALTNYLEIPHILSVTFKPLDTQKAYNKMEFEAKNIARLDFLMSEQHRAKSRDMFEFLNDVTTNGNSLVQVSVQCLVWKHGGQTDGYIQQVMKAFREMGAEAYIENLDTTNLFVSNAPCNAYQNFRWILMENQVAACYFNATTLLKSDKKGDLLCDRMGNPLLIDFYDTVRFENNNSLTIGVPGSGKSFTMGNLILQRFYRGERQIIIDVGGTYLSIFYAIPPDKCRYYEYDPEKPLKYNPFLVNYNELTGEFILSEAKMEFLINLIATIWRGNANLSNAERSILNKLLNQYYYEYNQQKQGMMPCVRGFYDFLKNFQSENHEEEVYKKIERNLNMDELLITLEPFAVGSYQAILNSDNNTDAERPIASFPLICFDLAKIKANPTLYPVVGMLIIELSCDIIDKYPKIIKRIYIDEAWSMLDGLLGGFIEYMYRTVRKCEGTISIITQGISEIQNSAIGTVVKDLSSTVIVLRHTDSNMIDKIVKFFGLSNHAEDLLKSLRKDAKDKWREIFVKRADLIHVYRVEVPSKIIPLLTSRAEERNRIREMSEGGKYFDYAINRFVEEWEKDN